MFVHTCRVCSGGNILVASNALMFCILMSLAEIQPLSSKLWGIGTALLLLPSVEIWCICFGRWDSPLVIFFLFSWRILFKWSRWRQQDPPAIASDISAGGVRIAEGKKKMIIATMRMMVVMMVMVIMVYHRFSGASERLLGVCLRLRSCFHTIFLPVSFSQLCTPSALLSLHLYHFVSLSSTHTIFCIAFLRATAPIIRQ